MSDPARWRAVEAGDVRLDWSLWSAPVESASALTVEGRRVVRVAVDAIADFLGADWLAKFLPQGDTHPGIRCLPLMSFRWWPANGTAHVFARLLTLGARILLAADAPGVAQVRRDMRQDIGHFEHGLLQLEVAGLALRDGLRVEFEPLVSSRVAGRADVRLSGVGDAVLVEVKGFRTRMQAASDIRLSDRLGAAVRAIEVKYEVWFDGDFGAMDDAAELERWVAEATGLAAAVARSGITLASSPPFGGHVQISPGPPEPGSGWSTPIRFGDDWRRIDRAIRAKAAQGLDDQPLWLRFDETSEFWSMSSPQSEHRAWVGALANAVASTVQQTENVAGLVLSAPMMMVAGGGTDTQIKLLDGRALVFGRRVGELSWRECLIVRRDGQDSTPQMDRWVSWYQNEAGWLDWALRRLGFAAFDELVVARS